MDDKLLSVRELKIEAQSGDEWIEIVHGIDLDLKRGEILGLIGESGAGKSTIGLATMGYTRDGCRISHGSVEFDGIELTKASQKEKQLIRGDRIAYVAQSAAASFNPAHTIMSQYVESPVVKGIMDISQAKAEGIELFEKLQLPNPQTIGFRYPHQVSGGQLQRAMTAMAMSSKPDLIIFDEPTTALDVTTQIEVLAAIRDIVREYGTSAIYITHDLAVVAQMADRIKVLLRGYEVEEDATKTMLSSPQEEYTRSLWAVRSFRSPVKPAVVDGSVPVIKIEDITARYGAVKVLDSVSFEIHRGRTVAVVGESGSGKSTVARVITGLLVPQGGRILLDDVELPSSFRDRDKSQLRRIQMIYQMADTALNPKQKVGDIIRRPVEFYLELKGQAATERVRSLLGAIELEPDQFYDRYPGELSGGQKQRIGIARALAAEPDFIICDEVTSALDQLVAEGILNLLSRFQKEFGLSYMFITHDLATVKAIADEVVVMQQGRVVECGEKEEMFRPPHHSYTELLLSSVPEMDADWLTVLLDNRAKKGTKFEN